MWEGNEKRNGLSGTGICTQGSVLDRQALYGLSHSSTSILCATPVPALSSLSLYENYLVLLSLIFATRERGMTTSLVLLLQFNEVQLL
jgi:hypothetical protein